MNAVQYSVFLPYVLPHVPNCFEEQALVAIRSACIEYCDGTQLLQQDMDPITTVVGQNTYEVDVPTGYRLGKVLTLYHVGARMERKSELELQKLYTRDWQALIGTPKVFTQFNPDEVVVALKPAESVRNAITGRICIIPSRASTVVDGLLFERHVEAITEGALARLKMTPDQPYTDVPGAMAHAKLFGAATANTRSLVNGGMNHAPLRARFNRIW